MENKANKNTGHHKIASASAVVMVLSLSAYSIYDILILQSKELSSINVTGLIMVAALILIIVAIRSAKDFSKLAFNIPAVLFAFYTMLLHFGGWNSPNYFLACLVFCGISCTYGNYNRTLTYIILQYIAIGFLILRGTHILGPGIPLTEVLLTLVVYIFGSIAMLIITRAATITLGKALGDRNSFRNLLSSTENYVAMVDESNKVIYASKTLSQLINIEEPALTHGRPLIDLFPGRSLKLLVGKMLKNKESYKADWEFVLNGQKRYFKAVSNNLTGNTGGTLISLYDMTFLAERDEIAAMKDSLKIGLFFMDRNYVIQDHYSRYLEKLLSESGLFGRLFTDIISNSVTHNELESIKDYFGMILERSYDQEMLDDINPLNELHYVNINTGDRKVFQCGFATVERGHGEVFILVTIYDITAKVELQRRLAEEEGKRQEEMQSLFELIQVEPGVFNDFMEDMEYEFGCVDKVLKDADLSAHEALVKIYQSIHAIKSNAVILGLEIFGNKVHTMESVIKKLREQEEEVPFEDMLNLTMELEKLSREREVFKTITEKLQFYSGGGDKKQNINVLIDSLVKTAEKASADMEKMVQFRADEIESEAVENGPRRVMKEILMQLIRNSVVHGIESPEDRLAKGKNETGTISLSIKLLDDKINISLGDDGKGLDYQKISERALHRNIIKQEDADNKDMLMKAIFSPGFSTADDEGLHAGRGIGLNLVRDRVKEVNGSIKLRSETDKGIVFFITIPVVKKQQAETL